MQIQNKVRRAPINFTSPNPIASFPAIRPPINVIIRKIPPPTAIPKRASVIRFILYIPETIHEASPTSNIVKFNLFGII